MVSWILLSIIGLQCPIPLGGRQLRQKQKAQRLRALGQDNGISALYPYYHTSDAMHSELQELSERCESMTFWTESNNNISIDVVRIRQPDAQPINKVFVLFGEHARELISPETGLALVKTLCGEGERGMIGMLAKDVLKDSEFQIVTNGNPKSRRKVEQGDFCLRVNENGVDLNRNWDEEWERQQVTASGMNDTNPGPRPFSEPETQIFKKLAVEYEPTTFLTIHSGTRGMYMPWAYDMEHLADRNEKSMMSILKSLDTRYCECPFGAAGREVGYACPGTCLDWIYDELKTPYSFAFEIYIGPEYDFGLKERFEEKMRAQAGAFYQQSAILAHRQFSDIFTDHPSCFVQKKANERHFQHLAFEEDPSDCFGRFNPNTEQRYKDTVTNWVSAYLDMSQQVVADIRRKQMASQAKKNTTKYKALNMSSPNEELLDRLDAEIEAGPKDDSPIPAPQDNDVVKS